MPTATYLRPNNISRLHVSTVCMIKINYVNKNNKILETKFLVRSKKKINLQNNRANFDTSSLGNEIPA